MPYKTVKIVHGSSGYGGPLEVTPTDDKPYIVSITGGGVDPVAQRIGELTGGQAVDGMKKGVANKQMACVVVDCGGTARCGVYPMLGIKTINLMDVGQSGMMKEHMKPEIYVSGVKPANVTLVEK